MVEIKYGTANVHALTVISLKKALFGHGTFQTSFSHVSQSARLSQSPKVLLFKIRFECNNHRRCHTVEDKRCHIENAAPKQNNEEDERSGEIKKTADAGSRNWWLRESN